MVVAMKNEHWTTYWKYLKEKKRRPSTKMVVAKNFFSKYFKNIREKKCEKKEQHPPFGERRSGPFLQSDDFRWKDKS